MIFDVPASIVKFCTQFLPLLGCYAPEHVVEIVPVFLAALVSSTPGRYSLSSLAKQVYGHVRDKSTFCRLLRCRQFRSRDLHWSAVRLVLVVLGAIAKKGVEWLLAIDATSIVRGASTRIPGGVHPDKREANKQQRKARKTRANGKRVCTAKERVRRKKAAKGRRTKYFTILMGSLITPFGVRIPLPRYTCDPKHFHRNSGRPKSKRDTQLDLAKEMIRKLLMYLPKGVKLVVVADSYYESEKLIKYAKARDFVFITPLDSNRCFAKKDNPNKSNRRRIWNYGLRLPWSSFSRLELVRGSESTVSYRRYCERRAGPKDRRTYWLHGERRTVAKLGEVAIVYSWKTPVYEPRRNFRKRSFKVLVCSDPNWSGERIVEWYEMRWTAIEILIRELKQHLGFEDYTGLSLEGMERYLDLVLLGFLYLEMRRFAILGSPEVPVPTQEVAATARTAAMKALVRAEADQQLLAALRQSYHFPRQKKRVMDFLSVASLPSQSATKPHVMRI